MTQVLPGTINTPLFDKARTKLGVKPVGLPPIYEPNLVTDLILYAAEHPARDLVAGGAAQAMILNQRLSPRLVDAILATRAGFEPQKPDEPKSEDTPDNLFEPKKAMTQRRTASGRCPEISTTGCRCIRRPGGWLR